MSVGDAETQTVRFVMLEALGTPEDPGPDEAAPSAVDCNNWTSAIYQYDLKGALSANFAIGSVKLDADYRLLVMDVGRTTTREVGDRVEQWGYGYRLLVEIAKASVAGSLTLAAIAAAVELNQTAATMRLQITGYKAEDMWDKLPVPRPLSVDTYREFLLSAERVQKQFGENPGAAVPVKLAVGAKSSLAADGVTMVEAREAVAVAMILNLARSEADLDAATRAVVAHSDLEDAQVRQLVQAVYIYLDTNGDGTSNSRAERASVLLETLRRGGWKLP